MPDGPLRKYSELNDLSTPSYELRARDVLRTCSPHFPRVSCCTLLRQNPGNCTENPPSSRPSFFVYRAPAEDRSCVVL